MKTLTEDEARWALAMAELEDELGVFPPSGAAGGVVAAASRRTRDDVENDGSVTEGQGAGLESGSHA